MGLSNEMLLVRAAKVGFWAVAAEAPELESQERPDDTLPGMEANGGIMRYIGIDPGLSGAVAVLSGPLGLEFTIFDTPVATVGKKREPVPRQMVEILRPYVENSAASLELVHAMPKQGVASAFNFGRGLGLWIGILAALGIPYDLVSPQRWKAVMMDGMGKEKDAARVRAMQLFPSASDHLALKKYHGRAEALLIAEYRRRLG